MHWKTTAILLVVTVGVGAYVSHDLKQPTPQEQRALTKQVARLDPESVSALHLDFPEITATLSRQDDVWRLTHPIETRADAQGVGRLLRMFNPLQADRILTDFEPSEETLATYGLQPPEGTLIVTTSEGEITFLFGATTAVGNRRYLTRSDADHPFIIHSYVFDQLNRSLDTYRSRQLLDFDRAAVRAIRVTSEETTYALAQEADVWNLQEPLSDLADRTAVATILMVLGALGIERFVSDAPEDDAQAAWGLTNPWTQITLDFEGETPSLEISIGELTEDNPTQRYVKRADEAFVYALGVGQLVELLKEPNALRARACFDFFTNQAATLTFSSSDHAWELANRDGAWWLADEQVLLDTQQVDAWLSQLRDMQVIRFVEELAPDASADLARYGIHPPQGTIRVGFIGERNPQELLIGKPLEEGHLRRYGYLPSRGTVVELPELIATLLAAEVESFAPSASAPEPAQVPAPQGAS